MKLKMKLVQIIWTLKTDY